MKKKPKTNKTVPVLCGVFAVLLIVMSAALVFGRKHKTAEFTPPPFDAAAIAGVPEVPESLGYISPYQEGMGYRFSVCGNVVMEGNNAAIYLTNPAENKVWLKLQVLDESNNILGETGLIRPGEYVKDVELTENLTAGTKIKLKIMGYEPETYFSAGSATLNTAIGDVAQ